jgi:hypothetical protein
MKLIDRTLVEKGGMAVSDLFIGSAVNAPLLRAVSPLVALQLSSIRIAS